MIKTKQDLLFFIEEDRKRNHIPPTWWGYYGQLIARVDQACIFRYFKCLRKYEYYTNNKHKNIIYHTMFFWYKFKWSRLGQKYNLRFNPNTIGYGVRVMHLCGGGGARIRPKKCGNYCGFNAGVIIGTKDGDENRPTIGDHVAFGPGSMAFGRITIGSNVFVAPNAVVTKDVPDNCIVGGIPAKILKYREPLSNDAKVEMS